MDMIQSRFRGRYNSVKIDLMKTEQNVTSFVSLSFLSINVGCAGLIINRIRGYLYARHPVVALTLIRFRSS